MLATTEATAGQRSFVSGSGADVGTCSPTAPCRSFGYAITHTNLGGEVIVLDSAGYGPVTVTQSVSIIAPPGIYGGISVSSGHGVTINAPGATVVLRGLSINGQGGTHGILAQQAARVRVEGCVISNMGGVGVYHTAPNGEMVVFDTITRDNADGVGLVADNGSILLDHVRSEHNQKGGFYVAPIPGSTVVTATVVDSTFVYNGANGVWADAVGGALTQLQVQVERSVMSHNGGDGFTATSGGGLSRATLSRNAMGHNNGSAIHVDAPLGGAFVYAVENVFETHSTGVFAEGGGATVSLSANSGSSISCGSSAHLVTYGNNAPTQAVLPSCVTKLGLL